LPATLPFPDTKYFQPFTDCQQSIEKLRRLTAFRAHLTGTWLKFSDTVDMTCTTIYQTADIVGSEVELLIRLSNSIRKAEIVLNPLHEKTKEWHNWHQCESLTKGM